MESIKLKTNYYSTNNNIVIVELGGYVDQTNSMQVEKVISDLLRSGKRNIVFDLSDLIYISSAGWGIFVGEIKTFRDNGGDIKVAGMSPDVYEVFQMLEFYHIIQDFATVDEAAESFFMDSVGAIKKINKDESIKSEVNNIEDLLKQSGLKTTVVDTEHDEKIVIKEGKQDEELKGSGIHQTGIGTQIPYKPQIHTEDHEIKIDISKLPLTEKIKKVAANFPLLNIFQIKKMLQHEKFGNTKISLFELYRTLKLLNLTTRQNRYRYSRSC